MAEHNLPVAVTQWVALAVEVMQLEAPEHTYLSDYDARTMILHAVERGPNFSPTKVTRDVHPKMSAERTRQLAATLQVVYDDMPLTIRIRIRHQLTIEGYASVHSELR